MTFAQKLATALAVCAFVPAPILAQETVAESAEAQELTALELRAEQVVALLNGDGQPEDIFTQEFLAAVPPAQMEAIGRQLTGQYGAAIAVESLAPPQGTRAALAIRMERAIARGGIAINPSDGNRVSELLFQSFEPIGDTPAKIEADLSALPGDVTWWYGPLDPKSGAIMANANDPVMPIGSTFKLYVLATLAREIREGKRNWDDLVTLGSDRSFPSGMMQDWPQDAPVTLHTLASLMISISDNTATDALIDTLGRGAVFQTLVESGHSEPQLNNPFLKTRDLFLLKAGPEGRLSTYKRGDQDLREQILEGIEQPPISMSEVAAAFSSGPNALDVEWFASADDLRGLMRLMRETSDPEAFEIMAINRSMPPSLSEKWPYAGYKGGSEPGVLNLTWLLTDSSGQDRALILSWRDPTAPVNESALEQIAQRILSLPH